MEFSKEIEKLIQKFTEGVLTEEEDKLLAKIVGQNQAVRQELVEALQFDDAMGQVLNDFRSKEMFKRGFIFRLEADTVIFDKKPRSVEKKTKSKNV